MAQSIGESGIKRFLKNSGVFFLGSVVSKAAMLMMLPLYTYYVDSADLGYYDLSTTCITLSEPLFSLRSGPWLCAICIAVPTAGRMLTE